MSFGERLRSLREDNDEKQKDIAKFLFVSANMISSYELGKHFPKDENALIALAKHFNVSLDYLLGYSAIMRNDIPKEYETILAECNGLLPDNVKSVVDYIRFLKSRQ
ncbi:MAG: helix-turn-helix domain-containing protein [Candidatus Ornithomonoglobus sp.]